MATEKQNGFKEIYLRLANEIYNASETEVWSSERYGSMLVLAQIEDEDVQVLLAGALVNFKYRWVKTCFRGLSSWWEEDMLQMRKIGKLLPRKYLTPSTTEEFENLYKTLEIKRTKMLSDNHDFIPDIDYQEKDKCPVFLFGEEIRADYDECTDRLLHYLAVEIESIYTGEAPAWY